MPIKQRYILVVGGAGFIGSHMALALQVAGYTPIVLDNLSTGHRDAVLNAELFVGNMSDTSLLDELCEKYTFSAVMHFASHIEVGESVKQPLKYYQNNVSATLAMLDVLMKHEVKTFIFSSTAAVYGEPLYTPIDEAHPLVPMNPYGNSKYIVEQVLRDLASSHGLRYASLRYFNAAGADPQGRLAERHEPESHLIPLVLQVAAGQREAITIYGHDYATPDGTCVRDYIHVSDLCDAHLLALEALLVGQHRNLICNLGTGVGHSVRQVIAGAREVTGHAIPVIMGARRPGDPAVLVAEASMAQRELAWRPKYPELIQMIAHAWQYYCTAETDVLS